VGELTSTLRGLSVSRKKRGKKIIHRYKKDSLTGTSRRMRSNGFRSEKD